ncbi:MAG: hydrogenase maturation protease [Deltaproteobacteria bacterium]|nr:hydrogenase maturation protease [Deltaproteobacteria bacterium]
MEAPQKNTLVLGLGNLLLGDEGVGVHAARALLNECCEGVKIQDVGTAILDALPALERADRVIVMDAMKGHGVPGTIYRVPMDQCTGNSCIASLHGFDLRSVLTLAGCEASPEVLVLGVEPAVIDWSMDLSPTVKKALPLLLETVREELSQ